MAKKTNTEVVKVTKFAPASNHDFDVIIEPIVTEKTMKLLLLGDVSPTNLNNALFEKQDVKTLFSDTLSLVNSIGCVTFFKVKTKSPFGLINSPSVYFFK